MLGLAGHLLGKLWHRFVPRLLAIQGEKGPLPTLLGFLDEQRELGRLPLAHLWGDWDFYLLGCGIGGWSNRHMWLASISRATRKPRDGGEGLPARTLALKQHLWRSGCGLETA